MQTKFGKINKNVDQTKKIFFGEKFINEHLFMNILPLVTG